MIKNVSIKKLVKDHRYDYIETGSLISIKKNTKNIRIPSEETRIEMYPMDYEEFRWALGDEVTVGMLREAYEARRTHRWMHSARSFRIVWEKGFWSLRRICAKMGPRRFCRW